MPSAPTYQIDVQAGPVYDVQVTSTETAYTVQVQAGPTYQVEMQLGIGPAGTITVGDVTTLPAGSPATVENVGTGEAARLNFGLPAGHDGSGTVNSVNGQGPDGSGAVIIGWTNISGTIPTSKIPAAALTIPTVVADEAGMLALTAQQGDVAIRSDTQVAYMLCANGDPTVLADWLAISTPGGVTSINGQQGVVVLGAADVHAATEAQGAKADTAVQPAGSIPIRTTWGGTQAEYDAIVTKDPNTLYVVTP